MQIERLVRMVFYIVDRGHVTAKELSERFGVSTRTIYRDMDTLTLAGIPVTSAKGTGGGISLMDGYTIDRSLFSQEEQRSIYQGLQILYATKYPDAGTALSKIGAIFRSVLEEKWLDVDLSYWGSDEQEQVKISDLRHAILDRHVISFDYFDSERNRSERTVEPMRLMFRSHAWYIVGYCRCKKADRTFRLSRIRHLQVMPETFERRPIPDPPLASDRKSECDVPPLELKFAPEIVYRLFDEFQEDQVRLCDDGSYRVTVRYELNDWTLHYLLSFGKYVEIVEPERARRMLKERAAAIVELYTRS